MKAKMKVKRILTIQKIYKLTNEEFKSLKKGDSKTGKGGTPLSELLA